MQQDNSNRKDGSKNEVLVENCATVLAPYVSSIMEEAEGLRGTELTHAQEDAVSQIQLDAKSMMSKLSDILDYLKIKEGRLSINTDEFDVKALVEETVSEANMEGFRKGLEVVCDIDHSIPDIVTGDQKRTSQVLMNIVKNAIEFTEEGYVRVELSVKDGENLVFRVTDSGIGVSDEDRDSIFELSTPDLRGRTRRPNHGFSLPLCRALVNLMGGKISMERNPYGGSIFWFSVPFTTVKNARASMYSIPVPANTKILVVDDSMLSAESTEKKLKHLGVHNVRKATNAKETLLTLKYAVDLGEPFDIVFIDMHMPLFDGWLLADDIRKNEKTSGTKLFIMVPDGIAKNFSSEKINGLFDGLIRKPMRLCELEKLLRKATGEDDSESILEKIEGL